MYLAGYAEGSDAELPGHILPWGFTIKQFNEVLNEADAEGVEEWERVNRWDDEDDLAEVMGYEGQRENYEDHKDKDVL